MKADEEVMKRVFQRQREHRNMGMSFWGETTHDRLEQLIVIYWFGWNRNVPSNLTYAYDITKEDMDRERARQSDPEYGEYLRLKAKFG